MANYSELAIKLHKEKTGKLEIRSKVSLNNKEELSVAYTPGVAAPCLEIHKNNNYAYDYTLKGNTIAMVSDGSAVLGLGNIGASASIPVIEGKSILFKEFANVDAFPICLDTNDVDEIVKTVKYMQPVFGGINLEDIAAPRCFEIEAKLKEELDIPIFHDDQHGTAIIVLSAIVNYLKLTKKKMNELKVIINGAGAAGIAVVKMLHKTGIEDIILCDLNGELHKDDNLNWAQEEVLSIVNREKKKRILKDAIIGRDIFVGVSGPECVTKDMVASMAEKNMVLALANPIPEIMPQDAKDGGAFIVGTGRSDLPNQVNNVLAFPGVFRGALNVRAKEINEEMKIAAAYAVADSINSKDLSPNNILPSVFDKNVAQTVSIAVEKSARETGVARI